MGQMVGAIARSRDNDLWRLINALGIRQGGEKAAKTLAPLSIHWQRYRAVMGPTSSTAVSSSSVAAASASG